MIAQPLMLSTSSILPPPKSQYAVFAARKIWREIYNVIAYFLKLFKN